MIIDISEPLTVADTPKSHMLFLSFRGIYHTAMSILSYFKDSIKPLI